MDPNATDILAKLVGNVPVLGALIWIIKMLLTEQERIRSEAKESLAAANARTDKADLRADSIYKQCIDVAVKFAERMDNPK